MNNLTASDRKSLIRLASSLPAGDKGRRAVLSGLSLLPRSGTTKFASKKIYNMLLKFYEEAHREIEKYEHLYVDEDGDNLLDLTSPRTSANSDIDNLNFFFSDVVTDIDPNDVPVWFAEVSGPAIGFEFTDVLVPTKLVANISGDFLRDFSFGSWENSALSSEFEYGPDKFTKSREGKSLEKKWKKKYEELVKRIFASEDFLSVLGKKMSREFSVPDTGYVLGKLIENENGFSDSGYVDYDGEPSVRFLDLEVMGKSFNGKAELTYDPKKMAFEGEEFGMESEDDSDAVDAYYGGRYASLSKKVAKDWIEKAVKRPGRLHKYFGIPEGEKIPVSKIDGEIKKLESKDDRTDEETSLLRALNLAKTFRKMGGMKKAGIEPFQARAVFMQFDYPEEYWHPKELPDDNFVDTDEAEDILRSEGLEMFQRGMGYDEVDEDGEEIGEDHIDVDEVYGDLIDEGPLERIYDDIKKKQKQEDKEDKDLPKPPRGMEWEKETESSPYESVSYILKNKSKEMGYVFTEDRSKGWSVFALSPRSKKLERISRNVKRLKDAAEQILAHLERHF